MNLAAKYILFAGIATAVNLLSQEAVIQLYPYAYPIPLSIFFGTVTGLLVKYILDKKYIFRFTTKNIQHDTQTFLLYSIMGLVTTAIFWGFEAGFEILFREKSMRYVGAIIGLSIGYVVKYKLDKKYVFSNRQ